MGWRRDEVYEGGGAEWEPPVSRAEQLMKAHPEITVIRDMTGDIFILQTFKHKWRHIHVDVKHEAGSQRHYPTVLIRAYDTPINGHRTEDIVKNIREYGLTTLVKMHVEDDEQVTPEVGYGKRQRYPQDFTRGQISYIESYANPIPAQELTTAARTGLEMLKAYGEASREQRERIDDTHTGYYGWEQIVDGTRPDIDTYIAEASPLLGNMMRREGISYAHAGTRSIYALNTLNKVTDTMLPSEIPPAPPNRREPRPRATTNLTALRRQSPRG